MFSMRAWNSGDKLIPGGFRPGLGIQYLLKSGCVMLVMAHIAWGGPHSVIGRWLGSAWGDAMVLARYFGSV